ncbi:Protein UBASH3A -like protein [Trichinella britovi]|uniref:Protein UBASH3A-like protein n=1 Tax=Trichinella britovi TaxID=45882 RepID=A0A0V1D614_TRIBR|nr:Protein UBASH3A -like protein [Trichinella britovi]
MGNASSADKQKQSDAESEKMKKAEEETKTGNESNKRNNHEHEAMSEMTNVGGYSMLYSMASDDGKQNSHEIFEIKKENKEKAQPVENKEAPETYCKKELTPKSKNSIQTRTPTSKQEKIRPVDDINAEETNVGGYTMLYSIAPDDDQPKPPTTGETKIKPSPIAETEKTKQLGKSPCKADSMQKSKKSSKTLTPPSKQEKIRPVDDNNAEETNVGGYTMLYSIAPDDDQPKPPTTGETKIKPSPIAETEKTKQLGKSPSPDDDQPKPPTTGETKIKPSPIAETEKTKQLGKSPCKADSMQKSKKSSKTRTPDSKQEKIRPVDDNNAEETNVGGYTMLYSIAPDDDQPKPPTTGETKIKSSPTVETEKTKQLRKSPCKADSMQKSRKSSKSLTPPSKQEKIRPVDDINAEETNVGGYTMLYSIAPDDDQPKPPTTGETKIKPSPIAETEKTKQLGKSPCKADSMKKSRKSSKSLTPPLKQEKIRPVDDINAEETNVGGYTMLYSIAPDDDQPKPPTTGETKIKSSPTVETEKTKQLRKSPCKADSMQKSRKSSKSLTPPLKQEKIRPVDDINAEETNVGGYTMLYSIAPDDDQPKPFVPVDRKIETCQIANQVDSQGRIAKFPEKVVPTELPIMNDGNLHEVRASDQQVLYEIKTGKTNAGKYSVDKEEVVANAATGILDALAPAKLNDALECIHLEMDQKGAVAGNQIIESPHGLTVVAEPTGRRVMLMRNAERIDRTFPEWIDVSFNDKGKYKSYDLNQPLEIPMRQDGHEAYRVDSPITELGNITAMMLGRAMKFRKYLPYKIFVSPAFRCIQTCHGFLKSVEDPLLSMQIEPALFEWLGWYKTMPSWMEFSDLLKSNYKINSTYKPVVEASDMKLYLNESVVNCYQRSINAFRQILENNKKEGNILFVVHSTTIDAITRFLNGKNIGNVSQEMLKSVEKNFPYSSVLIYEELADNTWRLMPDALPSITYLDVSNSVNMDFLNRICIGLLRCILHLNVMALLKLIFYCHWYFL